MYLYVSFACYGNSFIYFCFTKCEILVRLEVLSSVIIRGYCCVECDAIYFGTYRISAYDV
jgi:hypothetical protein